jgi:hypothetical protein
MNRYQRRKRALKRKDEKAELLLARAIMREQSIVKEALKDVRLRSELLKSDKLTVRERAILSFRKYEPKTRGVRSNASQWETGFSTRGASGKALFDVANDEIGKGPKPRRRAHSGFNHDPYSLEGEQIAVTTARQAYADCVPNCQRPNFKGPFKRKA